MSDLRNIQEEMSFEPKSCAEIKQAMEVAKRKLKEPYVIKGKKIEATLWTSPSRQAYWLLPGEFCCKKEAKKFKKYRLKAWQLRRSAIKKGLIVDVGDYYLVTETLVFDTVSAATSFVLASSRSGDVAKKGRKTLTGKNLC